MHLIYIVQNLTDGSDAIRLINPSVDVIFRRKLCPPRLRAVMSLARLLQAREREEARDHLAEVYGSFTEGFDTADLKETRVLLQELA